MVCDMEETGIAAGNGSTINSINQLQEIVALFPNTGIAIFLPDNHLFFCLAVIHVTDR